MQFNPDLNKQAQESIFSRKTMKAVHLAVQFNDSRVACVNIQKHIGLFLDEKLYFNHHFIKEKLDKAMKGVNVINKSSNVLPIHSLIIVYKSFVRPHLNYGDMTNV